MDPVSEVLVPEGEMARMAAEAASGEETVFLLFGELSGGVAVCRRVVRADARVEGGSFEVDPFFLALELARARLRGEGLVGVAHSHPGGSHPSAADLAGMRDLPVVWLVFGRSDPPRAWFPTPEGVREIRIGRISGGRPVRVEG